MLTTIAACDEHCYAGQIWSRLPVLDSQSFSAVISASFVHHSCFLHFVHCCPSLANADVVLYIVVCDWQFAIQFCTLLCMTDSSRYSSVHCCVWLTVRDTVLYIVVCDWQFAIQFCTLLYVYDTQQKCDTVYLCISIKQAVANIVSEGIFN